MTTTVERLGPDDWARFRTVRQASLRGDPSAFAASAHRWLDELDVEQHWRSRLADVVTLVATRSGVDVGTAGLDRSGQLIGMWVDPAVRGTGVGWSLVEAVLALAPPDVPMHLRVMADNGPGVRFYERCGFRLVTVDADAEGCLAMTYAPSPGRA